MQPAGNAWKATIRKDDGKVVLYDDEAGNECFTIELTHAQRAEYAAWLLDRDSFTTYGKEWNDRRRGKG